MSQEKLIIFPILCFYQLFESQLYSKNSVTPVWHFLKHCMSERTLSLSISCCHTAITYVYNIITYVSFLVFIHSCMYFVMLTFSDNFDGYKPSPKPIFTLFAICGVLQFFLKLCHQQNNIFRYT